MTPRSLRRAAERKAAKESRRRPIPVNSAPSLANRETTLTGRTILPTADADRYARHLSAYERSYNPTDERERELVQAIADAAWRLDRTAGLEEALYYKGALEFSAEVIALDARTHASMLRLHTYLAYERQFKNLHTEERRLQRQRERLIAELKELQAERQQQEEEEQPEETKELTEIGFEFSTEANERGELPKLTEAPTAKEGVKKTVAHLPASKV